MGSNQNNASFLLELDTSDDSSGKFSDEIESLKKDLLKTDRSVEITRKRQKLSSEEAGEGLLMNILEITLNPAVLGLLIKVVHDWYRYKTAVQKRPFKMTIKNGNSEISIDTEKDINTDEIVMKAQEMLANGNK